MAKRTRRPSSTRATAGARERILLAARALFSEKGFHQTSIREIAARGRINSQLIYYYFGGKPGLRNAVLEDAATRVYEMLQEAARGPGSADERLRSFIVAWAQDVLSEATAIRMLFRLAHEGDADVLAIVRERAARNGAAIRQLLQDGINHGQFRSDLDPRFAAASLASLVFFPVIFGAVVLPAMALDHEPQIVGRLAHHTADLFLSGIMRAESHGTSTALSAHPHKGGPGRRRRRSRR